MKKYSIYKPSGVNWIGDIPENWNTLKLKHEYKIQKGRIPKTISEKEDEGLVPYLSMEVLRGSDTSSFVSNDDGVFVNEGQTLILWDGSNSGEIIKVEKEGILSSTMGVLNKIGNKLNEDFSFYQLKSHEPEIRNNTNGMGIPHVDGQYVRSLVLLTPPLQEQEQIVNYLDEKTTIIDKLISTKQRKVELLKEQRTTLINQVITKGLNPNVKMKDSGVEWVGEIPESWIVGKLKNYSELRISSVDKHIYEYERQVIVCNYTDVYYNEFITNELELRKGSCSDDEYNKFKLNKGDVIITKDSESPTDIGVPSLVNDDFENVVCGYHLSIIKPSKNKLVGSYLFRQLQTKRIRSYYEVCSNGITRFGLGKSSVLDTPLIIPPVNEQQEIVEYLDKHTNDIDDLVSMEQNKLELLKEYRQSLISEVITGKIKVV
jgi:type I restriction enzyme S subunit